MASSVPSSEYFSFLAVKYGRQTGTSTSNIFLSSWDAITSAKPITSSSVIHDNAAGPGTSTSIILEKLSSSETPEILITDNNAAMVNAAKEAFASRHPSITAAERDSVHPSPPFPAAHFTHSITNFSIFLFSDPLLALQNVHNSLQPGGLAAVLTWKRFGFGETIHAAQRDVRPDLPVMPLPGPQFLKEGVLAGLVAEAGFSKDRIQVLQREFIAKGDALQGLKEFMMADFGSMATKEWPDEDKAKWESAVDRAVKSEVESFGGVMFEAWVVIASK